MPANHLVRSDWRHLLPRICAGAALGILTAVVLGWPIYLVPTMTAFLLSVRRSAAAAPTRPPAPAPVS